MASNFRDLLNAAKGKVRGRNKSTAATKPKPPPQRPTLPASGALSLDELGSPSTCNDEPSFVVVVHRARNLIGAPPGSQLVCSCVCGKEKHETSAADETVAPYWEQNLVFQCSSDGEPLVFEVRLANALSKKKKVTCLATLTLDSSRRRPRAWHLMAPVPGGGAGAEVELTVRGGNEEATTVTEETVVAPKPGFPLQRSLQRRSPLRIDPDSPMNEDALRSLLATDSPATLPQVQNVRVGVRVRPPISSEAKHGSTVGWSWAQGREGGVMAERSLEELEERMSEQEAAFAHDSRGFEAKLDRVFGPEASTALLYDAICQPVVKQVLEGFNGTIFAYGQTASGKTHTIMGDSREPGVIILALKDIFSFIEEQRHVFRFAVRVTYAEIYQENVLDLLKSRKPSGRHTAFGSTRLSIVNHEVWGPSIKGCVERVVQSVDEALEVLFEGEKSRHIGATSMNHLSSRSHVVMQQVFRRMVTVSTLSIIDLAGSERVSKSRATGVRLEEAGRINKSLSALGNVISAINQKSKHIPFRSSKLTHLLSNALGGNSYTAVLCCVSPVVRHISETRSTLLFAQRAQRIVNCAKLNQVEASNAALVAKDSKIRRLQKQLREQSEMMERLRLQALEQAKARSAEETAALLERIKEPVLQLEAQLHEARLARRRRGGSISTATNHSASGGTIFGTNEISLVTSPSPPTHENEEVGATLPAVGIHVDTSSEEVASEDEIALQASIRALEAKLNFGKAATDSNIAGNSTDGFNVSVVSRALRTPRVRALSKHACSDTTMGSRRTKSHSVDDGTSFERSSDFLTSRTHETMLAMESLRSQRERRESSLEVTLYEDSEFKGEEATESPGDIVVTLSRELDATTKARDEALASSVEQERERDVAAQSLTGLRSELDTMTSEFDELRSTLESTESARAEIVEARTLAEEARDEALASLEASRAEIASLRDSLERMDEKDGEAASLMEGKLLVESERSDAAEKKLRSLQAELEAEKMRNVTLESTLSKSEESLTALSRELDATTKARDEALASSVEHERERDVAAQSLTGLRSELDTMTSEFDELRSTLESTESARAEIVEARTLAEEARDEALASLEASRAEIASLRDSLERMDEKDGEAASLMEGKLLAESERSDAAEKKLRSLQAELEAEKMRNVTLESTLGKSEESLTALSRELDATTKARDEALASSVEHERKRDVAAQSLTGLRSELDTMTSEFDELRSTLESTESARAEIVEARTLAEEARDEALASLEASRAEIASLRDSLERANAELEIERTAKIAIAAENDGARREREDVERGLRESAEAEAVSSKLEFESYKTTMKAKQLDLENRLANERDLVEKAKREASECAENIEREIAMRKKVEATLKETFARMQEANMRVAENASKERTHQKDTLWSQLNKERQKAAAAEEQSATLKRQNSALAAELKQSEASREATARLAEGVQKRVDATERENAAHAADTCVRGAFATRIKALEQAVAQKEENVRMRTTETLELRHSLQSECEHRQSAEKSLDIANKKSLDLAKENQAAQEDLKISRETISELKEKLEQHRAATIVDAAKYEENLKEKNTVIGKLKVEFDQNTATAVENSRKSAEKIEVLEAALLMCEAGKRNAEENLASERNASEDRLAEQTALCDTISKRCEMLSAQVSELQEEHAKASAEWRYTLAEAASSVPEAHKRQIDELMKSKETLEGVMAEMKAKGERSIALIEEQCREQLEHETKRLYTRTMELESHVEDLENQSEIDNRELEELRATEEKSSEILNAEVERRCAAEAELKDAGLASVAEAARLKADAEDSEERLRALESTLSKLRNASENKAAAITAEAARFALEADELRTANASVTAERDAVLATKRSFEDRASRATVSQAAAEAAAKVARCELAVVSEARSAADAEIIRLRSELKHASSERAEAIASVSATKAACDRAVADAIEDMAAKYGRELRLQREAITEAVRRECASDAARSLENHREEMARQLSEEKASFERRIASEREAMKRSHHADLRALEDRSRDELLATKNASATVHEQALRDKIGALETKIKQSEREHEEAMDLVADSACKIDEITTVCEGSKKENEALRAELLETREKCINESTRSNHEIDDIVARATKAGALAERDVHERRLQTLRQDFESKAAEAKRASSVEIERLRNSEAIAVKARLLAENALNAHKRIAVEERDALESMLQRQQKRPQPRAPPADEVINDNAVVTMQQNAEKDLSKARREAQDAKAALIATESRLRMLDQSSSKASSEAASKIKVLEERIAVLESSAALQKISSSEVSEVRDMQTINKSLEQGPAFNVVRALHAYDAVKDGDLSIATGELLFILRLVDKDWAFVARAHAQGHGHADESERKYAGSRSFSSQQCGNDDTFIEPFIGNRSQARTKGLVPTSYIECALIGVEEQLLWSGKDISLASVLSENSATGMRIPHCTSLSSRGAAVSNEHGEDVAMEPREIRDELRRALLRLRASERSCGDLRKAADSAEEQIAEAHHSFAAERSMRVALQVRIQEYEKHVKILLAKLRNEQRRNDSAVEAERSLQVNRQHIAECASLIPRVGEQWRAEKARADALVAERAEMLADKGRTPHNSRTTESKPQKLVAEVRAEGEAARADLRRAAVALEQARRFAATAGRQSQNSQQEPNWSASKSEKYDRLIVLAEHAMHSATAAHERNVALELELTEARQVRERARAEAQRVVNEQRQRRSVAQPLRSPASTVNDGAKEDGDADLVAALLDVISEIEGDFRDFIDAHLPSNDTEKKRHTRSHRSHRRKHLAAERDFDVAVSDVKKWEYDLLGGGRMRRVRRRRRTRNRSDGVNRETPRNDPLLEFAWSAPDAQSPGQQRHFHERLELALGTGEFDE